MFIPLHDANSLRRIRLQWVTLALIAANVAVHLVLSTGTATTMQGAVIGLGYIPSVVFDTAVLPPGYAIVPEDLTYLTYSFLHADWLHLGGNMLFLWVFGDNVEDALGHLRFLLFYLLSAAAGALAHGLLVPESQAPLIGASGAVAGILSAYLILHPRVKIWVLAFGRIPLRVPAWVAIARLDRVPDPDARDPAGGRGVLCRPFGGRGRRCCPGRDPASPRPAAAGQGGRHPARGRGRAARAGGGRA